MEAATLVPVVVQGARGRLSGFYYAPPSGRAVTNLLLAPAFAEEMNRCRAMVAMQARALAAAAVGTLVLDPFGTGDSEGEFVQADWATWCDDLAQGVRWLREQAGGCCGIWGVRLGAQLAAQLARQDPGLRHLLLWQPVTDGKSFYTQLLRVRIAADMHLPQRVKTTAELRAQSAAGQAVQVSGYNVSPMLAAELDRLVLDSAALAAVSTDWFEVLASDSAPTAASTTRLVDAARQDACDLQLHTVIGPPFWQVHEREVAPALIEATTERVRAWPEVLQGGAAASATFAPPDGALPELPITFACGAERLSGVLHRAERTPRLGVVIVVAGGPQYRAGAHRQWVGLARQLSGAGVAALRFDLRGMGDSTGVHVGYEQSGPDISAAVDALLEHEPGLSKVILLGECESASGILFYAWRDPRIAGTVLINPWVRTEEGRAQVIVKNYYLDRLRSREFWDLVRSGRFDLRRSIASTVGVMRAYFRGRRQFARAKADPSAQLDALPLPLRTAEGLRRFGGPVLLLMSGRDLIAQEFDEVVKATNAWAGLLEDRRVTRRDIEGADHTFSKDAWKQAAADAVTAWVVDQAAAGGPASDRLRPESMQPA